MGLIYDLTGNDDEEFWASVPLVGPAREAVINIPDDTWNSVPVLGPARKAVLTMEDITKVPSWVWIAAGVIVAAVIVKKVLL